MQQQIKIDGERFSVKNGKLTPIVRVGFDKFCDNLGAKIRHHRNAKRMTLTELACKTELSMSLLSQIEHGNISPSMQTLWKLSSALKMSFKIDARKG